MFIDLFNQENVEFHLIYEDGTEINVFDWDEINDDRIRFIRISTPYLKGKIKDDSIVLSRHCYDQAMSIGDVKWQVAPVKLPGVKDRFKNCKYYHQHQSKALDGTDGYTDSMNTLKAAAELYIKYDRTEYNHVKIKTLITDTQDVTSVDDYLPAISAAYNATETYMGREINGYLASEAQLMTIRMYSDALDCILTLLGEEPLEFLTFDWWSSTEFGDVYAYICKHDDIDGTNWLSYHPKITTYSSETQLCVLPLYKLNRK